MNLKYIRVACDAVVAVAAGFVAWKTIEVNRMIKQNDKMAEQIKQSRRPLI